MEESSILVLDNGGNTIKAGLAGDDHPSVVTNAALGLEPFPRLSDPDIFSAYKTKFASDGVSVRRPIQNGLISNWEDMEEIWSKVIYEQMHIAPEEMNLLITEPVQNSRPAREKIGEIMLEKFGFRGISIATAPILPMYAAGRTTGIVLDVGEGVTQVVPVWGGYPITDAMKRLEFGGAEITNLLQTELSSRSSNGGCVPPEVAKFIKEKCCYIALDGDQTKSTTEPTQFQLPNGETIDIGEEAWTTPEFLFDPGRWQSLERNGQGLHQLVYSAVMKTNIDVRKDLFANIVLAGGSTLFPGLPGRLEKLLRDMVPATVPVKIVAHPGRKYFTWIGGSVLASLTSFPNTLVTKEQWADGSGRGLIGKIHN